MTGWSMSLGTGRTVAGELDALYLPRRNSGKRAVVMCHGFGGTALRFAGYAGTPYQTKLAHLLAAAGLVVVAADFRGDSMGNDLAADAVNAAWTLAKTNGAASDKVLLYGNSMGHGTACGFTRKYGKASVAAIVGVSPMVNLTAGYAGQYEASVPGAQAAIQTAWGVTYPEPLPAGADPILDPATHADIPRRLYSSTNDPTVPWADVNAFAGAVAGTTVIQAGSQVAHSDPVMADIDLNTIVDFLRDAA